jgi:hypothetical protein
MATAVQRLSLLFMTNLIRLHFPANEVENALRVSWRESHWNPFAHNAVPPDDSYGLFQINMLGYLGPARRRQFKILVNSQLYDPNINVAAARMIWEENGRSWRGSAGWMEVPAVRNYPSEGGSNNWSGFTGSGDGTDSDAYQAALAKIQAAIDRGELRNASAEDFAQVVVNFHEGTGYYRLLADEVIRVAGLTSADITVLAAGVTDIIPGGTGGGLGGVLDENLPNPGDALSALMDLVRILMNPDFWKRIGLGVLGTAVVLVGIVLFTKESVK